jgi:hypothetical protein
MAWASAMELPACSEPKPECAVACTTNPAAVAFPTAIALPPVPV